MTRFGRFSVVSEAGRGASGAVLRARSEEGREVALKVYDARAASLVRTEVLLLASLSHGAIPRYVEHGETDGQLWFAMDWIDGPTLDAALGAGPLAIPDAIALGRRVAAALLHAHRVGVTHLDVKPANLVLEGGSPARAFLVDFGIASARGGPARRGGTPGYMATELASGAPPSAAADVFGLGCVLYECLLGTPAFDGETAALRHARALHASPPSLDPLGLASHVADTLARMLDKDPRARPSLREVLATLDPAGAEIASSATSPSEAQLDATPSTRRAGPLVGRDVELRLLTSSFEAARDEGQVGLVLVDAHAGAGKSRLIEELVSELGRAEVPPQIWIARAEAVIGKAPRALLRALLSAALSEAEPSGALAREATAGRADHHHLARALGLAGTDDRAARILAAFAGLVDPQADLEVADLAARGNAWETAAIQSLTTWLRTAASRGPLVIVLEDLHHADTSSVDVLTRCLRDLGEARLFVVASTRSDHEHGSAFLDAGAQRLVLRPLTWRAAERLTRSLGHALPAEHARSLWERSGGSPLFFEELLRRTAHAGAETVERALPASLRAAIEGDLARLSPLPILIVELASLMGARVRRDDLVAIFAGDDPLSLDLALEELSHREVLAPPSRAGGSAAELVFRHALWQEAAAERVPPRARLDHRARIVARLRDHDPRAAASQCELMAETLRELGEDPAASWGEAGLLWRAGRTIDRAVETFARAASTAPLAWLEPLGEGLAFVRRATPDLTEGLHRAVSALGEASPTIPLVAAARGFAALGLGDDARKALERARASLDASSPVDEGTHRRYLEAAIEVGIRRGAFADAAAAFAALADTHHPIALRTRVFAALALAATGDVAGADRALDAARRSPEAQEPAARAEISKYDVLVRTFARDFERGVHVAEQAIDDARAAELPFHEAVALHNLGDLLHRLGRLAAARAALEASEVLSERHGFRTLRTGNRAHLRYIAGLEGDASAALDLTTEITDAETAGALGAAVDGRCLLARLYRATGDEQRARAEYETILRLAGITGQRLAYEEAREALAVGE